MLRLILVALVAGLAGTYVIRRLERRRLEHLAQIRAAFLAVLPESAAATAVLKDVHVRDTTVRLRVPQAWAEEYPDDASARFQDRHGSGRALRVTSSTISGSTTTVADALRARARECGPTTVETLPSGDVLLKALSEESDASGQMACFIWMIGRLVSADRLRVATFTFTAPLATAHDVFTRNEVLRLEHEVRAAQIA